MRRAASLLTAVLLAVVAAGSPALAAAVPLPREDAFYTYDGSTPLAQVAPGTVLRSRQVTLGLSTFATPIPATQLLYRTADEQGRPSVTVTTVAVPPGATVAPKIVAYLSFYDSLSGRCSPSYTLQGGDPGADNATLTTTEQALVAQYYASGYIVTVPDFEGTDLHWTAGHEAGYGTLDGIRATQRFLGLAAGSPVALSGYSGGSIAADWASELAPAYAPAMNLVGVAEAGIPVNFAHNLNYIEGSKVWSGIIPAVLVALSRAYGINLDTYLNDKGKALTAKVADQCIGDFSGTTPGLRSDDLLKPEYRPLLAQPEFVAVINQLIMGSVPGAPRGPLLMAVGNDPANAGAGPSDAGRGDDIMLTGDVEALARQYCDQGVPVQFQVFRNSSHENAALQFEPVASAFLAARFAGLPFADSCATVGRGNDLSPIAAPQPAPAASPSATPAAGSVAAAPPVRGALALTGAGSLAAVLGLLLLAAAAALRGRPGRR